MRKSPEQTTPSPQLVDLPQLGNHAEHGPAILAGNMDAIQHVKVRVAVHVGGAEVTVGELLSMREDHIITLDSLADAPVDVMLEGRVIARGQLVVVDDNFGVRLTELPKAGS